MGVDNMTQQERHQASSASPLSTSQRDRGGIPGPSPASVPRSTRPNTSLADSYHIIDSDTYNPVTSPVSYQAQSLNAQRPQDSFQFQYSPFVYGDNAASFPPSSSPSSSLLSAVGGHAGASSGTWTGASQQGPPVNREGGLSRTKSLAMNPTARQALLQQQRYQQQQQEQYFCLSQSYSNNSTPADTPTPRTETVTPTINPFTETAELVSTLSQIALKSTGEKQMPVLESIQQPIVTTAATHNIDQNENSATNTTLQEERQTQQDQQAEPLQTPPSPPPAYSTVIQGETPNLGPTEKPITKQPPSPPTSNRPSSSVQFGDNQSPPSSSQRQQRNEKTSAGASFTDSPLARAGTVSSNNVANANFFTHLVPKKNIAQNHTPDNTHVEDGPGPAVLIAIGKTGQGKSSLLNVIMGTKELKASASVRAVTKGIAERSGWARFEDNRRFLVTVADTPGLADTEGDDEKNIPILKEYISSVGSRLGVTAFLLVFKIDSSVDIIMTILKSFNEIMLDFPNVWDNVILVFTGCDYRRDILATKQLLHRELKHQIKEHILDHLPPRPSPVKEDSFTSTSSSTSSSFPRSYKAPLRSATSIPDNADSDAGVPMVFLTTAENVCSFALGAGRCDCDEHSYYLRSCLKRLWYEARKMKRWVIGADDLDFSGHV